MKNYFLFFTLPMIFINGALVDDKCNFKDIQFQPNTFKLLSRTIIPELEGKAKGESGRIGVIGGSAEFTGPPYFSAITALKVGADLVYVITTDNASSVIKAYSPDLIVYPYFNSKYASKIRALLLKMDVVIIGPGLGRESDTLHLIYDIIEDCRNLGKPLVIDSDGLYAVTKNITVLKDYPCPGAVMTPNRREATRLMEAITKDDTNWFGYWGKCVSVLVKGEKDHLFSNTSSYAWAAMGGGSIRRVGGQGDILTGAMATFLNWALKSELCKTENHPQLAQSVAAYAAAKITRLCNNKAYARYGRGMIASDMIQELHESFESTFFWV